MVERSNACQHVTTYPLTLCARMISHRSQDFEPAAMEEGVAEKKVLSIIDTHSDFAPAITSSNSVNVQDVSIN